MTTEIKAGLRPGHVPARQLPYVRGIVLGWPEGRPLPLGLRWVAGRWVGSQPRFHDGAIVVADVLDSGTPLVGIGRRVGAETCLFLHRIEGLPVPQQPTPKEDKVFRKAVAAQAADWFRWLQTELREGKGPPPLAWFSE